MRSHQPVDRDQDRARPRSPSPRRSRAGARAAAAAWDGRSPDAGHCARGQELLGVGHVSALGLAEQPGVLERSADGRLEPPERLRVAEPAGTVLQVGLEQRGDGSVAIEAHEGVRPERGRERPRVGPDVRLDRLERERPTPSASPASTRPSSIAVVASRCSAATGPAFLGRAQGVAHAEPRVPQRVRGAVRRAPPLRPMPDRRGRAAGRCPTRATRPRVRIRRARRARCPRAAERRRTAPAGTHPRARLGGRPTSGRDARAE